MRRRRAFTIVEVLIMSFVALFLLGIVYSFFASSTKDSVKMSRKLQALQAAHLLLERLAHDLKQAHYEEGRFSIRLFDFVDGAAQSCSFYRLTPGQLPRVDDGALRLERVRYHFDGDSSRMFINDKVFAAGCFKRVRFRYVKGVPGNYLSVVLTGVADDQADVPLADIDKRDVATVVTNIAFRSRAVKRAHPTWVSKSTLVR